jgi:hypothetical protein
MAALLWLAGCGCEIDGGRRRAALSGLFSFYAANFGKFKETYGSLGAIIGFMTWLWISAMVVLLGAEVDAEMERQTDNTMESPKPLDAEGARWRTQSARRRKNDGGSEKKGRPWSDRAKSSLSPCASAAAVRGRLGHHDWTAKRREHDAREFVF